VLDSCIYGYERQRALIGLGGDAAAAPAQGVLDAAQAAFPSLGLVAKEYADEPFDDHAAFDFGLGLLLDGLERLLEQQQAG
jgi:hypothetical protein